MPLDPTEELRRLAVDATQPQIDRRKEGDVT
jgi:hypothetical protein